HPMPNLLGEYNIQKTLGQGAFSKVKLAVHRETGAKLAVKIIDKKMMDDMREKQKKNAEQKRKKREKSKTKNEVKMMVRLNHPNIIRIYQVIDTPTECFVVMDFAKGELTDLLATRERLSERDARKFFRQLVSAIDHCHLANVVHRDLKLENLLIGQDGQILVSDFGLGKTYLHQNILSETFCGTPNYAAIELITGTPYLGAKVDIWAMGVILYVLVSGRAPFQGSSIAQLYDNIKSLNYNVPEYFSSELIDLLAKIFVKDPMERIDMDRVRTHPWVNIEY
ncbi:kinase-like domain-containing protein, partial [Gorgonomyces haynaldii]